MPSTDISTALSGPDPSVEYAREVYAACATIGFLDDNVMRLKAWLDVFDAGEERVEVDIATVTEVAKRAHLAAGAWAAGGAT